MSALPLKTPAATVPPRLAATVLLLRDGPAGLDVLMVRRSPNASFMPGAYVFPGGAVDAADGSAETQRLCDESADALTQRLGTVTGVGAQAGAFAVAALRECFEECGLWLGEGPSPAAAELAAWRQALHGGEPLAAIAARSGRRLATSGLQPLAHWVTPVGVPKRFDTLFLLARAPADQQPSPDAGETTTLAWVHPPEALAQHAQGRFPMEFATVTTLRSLLPFATAAGATASPTAALLAHARALTAVPALHPRLKLDAQGAVAGVLLPGEAGYDQAWRG